MISKGRVSKEEEADCLTGLDASDDLRAMGIYYITGEIDTDTLVGHHQDIIYKYMNGWSGVLQILVNTVGGSVAEGMAFADLLEWAKSKYVVRTVAMGCCASMGAILACTGTQGHRIAMPSTIFMIHQGHQVAYGNRTQFLAAIKELEIDYKYDINFWIKASKYNTEKEVVEHFLHGNHDVYLSVKEAMEHGIIDGIVGEETDG
jgi:ATP-dependent Clp endopeptidase proteolytic subunit ClpP